MRKIKVSGCLNCPYCIKQNDTTIDGKSITVAYICNHQSFQVLNGAPKIPLHFIQDLENGVEFKMCGEDYMPTWCPLEYDVMIHSTRFNPL